MVENIIRPLIGGAVAVKVLESGEKMIKKTNIKKVKKIKKPKKIKPFKKIKY